MKAFFRRLITPGGITFVMVGFFPFLSIAQVGSGPSGTGFYGLSPRAFEPSENHTHTLKKREPAQAQDSSQILVDSSWFIDLNRNLVSTILSSSSETAYWTSRVRELNHQSVLDLMPYLLLHATEVAFHIPLIPPLFSDQPYHYSSGFGLRQHPVLGKVRLHAGIDLAGPVQPIKVTAFGKVERVAYESGYGLYILVNHGNTYHTLYGHLSKTFVKEGQEVQVGQPIGTLGCSGRVTGYHLHYEIRKNGKSLNPIQYLRSASQFIGRYQKVVQKAISLGLGSRIIREYH